MNISPPPLANIIKYASLQQDRVNRPFPVLWRQWEDAHVHTFASRSRYSSLQITIREEREPFPYFSIQQSERQEAKWTQEITPSWFNWSTELWVSTSLPWAFLREHWIFRLTYLKKKELLHHLCSTWPHTSFTTNSRSVHQYSHRSLRRSIRPSPQVSQLISQTNKCVLFRAEGRQCTPRQRCSRGLVLRGVSRDLRHGGSLNSTDS